MGPIRQAIAVPPRQKHRPPPLPAQNVRREALRSAPATRVWALRRAVAREVMSKSQEDCGAPRACVRCCKGSLAAPRYGGIEAPRPLIALFRGPSNGAGRDRPRPSSRRRGAVEPLRWSRYPAAPTLHHPLSGEASGRAVRLRRRIPRPELKDGLQLASSRTRDGRSLVQPRQAGISSGAGCHQRTSRSILPWCMCKLYPAGGRRSTSTRIPASRRTGP